MSQVKIINLSKEFSMKKNMLTGLLMAGALAMMCDVQAMNSGVAKGADRDAEVLRQVQYFDQQTCVILHQLAGVAQSSAVSCAQMIFEATGDLAVKPCMDTNMDGQLRDLNFIAQIMNRYSCRFIVCCENLKLEEYLSSVNRDQSGKKIDHIAQSAHLLAQELKQRGNSDKGFVADFVETEGMHGIGMLIFIAMVGNRYAHYAATLKKDETAQIELDKIYGRLHGIGKDISRESENVGVAAGNGWSNWSVRDVLGAALIATVAVAGFYCSHNPQAAYCPACLFQ